MEGNDHLSAGAEVLPFLVTPLLADLLEAMGDEDTDDFG